MSTAQKSSLNYLIQEALAAGGWELVDPNGNAETWERETEQVKIGKKELKGSNPPSIVFEIADPSIEFRKTDMIVINLLCTRLAKRQSMSAWYGNVNNTTE